MFDEQVDFVTNAPDSVFPYLGRRVGKPDHAIVSAHAGDDPARKDHGCPRGVVLPARNRF
jgi:hypothetical protein